MADKLSWTELRKALASRAGANEREARMFLEALNTQIIEGLRQDKQVKINGIGTFRLQTVAARESVNVTTGERITIEQYDKIAFSAEAGMKELIEHNTPMKKQTNKKAAEDVNPLKKLGEQATEIVDILADMGQAPAEEPKKAPKPKRTRKPKAVAEPVEEEQPVAEEQPVVEAPAAVVEPVVEEKPIVEEKPVVAEAPKAEEKPVKRNTGVAFARDTIICIVVMLMLLLLGYFFMRHQISDWFNALNAPHIQDVSEYTAPAYQEPEAASSAIPMPEVYDDEVHYTKWITTEKMHEDSRLAWMAWRYYGNKDFWVYLYDANKDHIVNPDKIKVGTPIRVPRLTAEQMDTNRADTRRILQRLTEQGEAAKLR